MSTVTTIKRGGLTAAIDSMGAQLTRLALNGNEYLWQGDPAFWGKHAPILFPIVGSLRNNTATSAAGTCEMPRHGLARIVEDPHAGIGDRFADVDIGQCAAPIRLTADACGRL